MSNTRIKDLESTAMVSNSDSFAVDGPYLGTKKMTFASLWNWVMAKAYNFAQGSKSIPEAINELFENSTVKTIQKNTDLDNLKNDGIYNCTAQVSAYVTNKPVSTADFILIVYTCGTTSKIQILIENTSNLSRSAFYIRSGNGTVWYDWKTYSTSVDTAKKLDLVTLSSEIPKDSDLNTYKTFGQYRASTAGIAQSLANCPVSNKGFIMFVINGCANSNASGLQIIIPDTGESIFVRKIYPIQSTNPTTWREYGSNPVATVITKQPNDVSAQEGASATFSVTATGTGLTYAWQYSSNTNAWSPVSDDWSSGKSTRTLTVAASTDLNNKYFRCVITLSGGSTINSRLAKLTVSQ